MKTICIIIGTILASGLIFYLFSCKSKLKSNNQTNSQFQDNVRPKKTMTKENKYSGLRNQSLSVTPEQLNLKLDNSKTIVYGVVMDWDMNNVIATVVAFQTGDVSLYLSTGQLYIGGYAHENIKKAGLSLVNEAQNFLSTAKMTNLTTIPDKECVGFYLLTNKGKYFYQETITNIENKSSNWATLFDLGNNVITEYRLTIGNN